MKKVFTLFILFLGLLNLVKAQVGIGVANPAVGTILDLTNVNNKSARLPISSVNITSLPSFSAPGMVMSYNNYLVLKTDTSINFISPWIYNGTPANGISLASGIPVGIGLTPLSSSPVSTQILSNSDVTVSDDSASLALGIIGSNIMLFDNDEILVKTNSTTTGVLKLQDDGGTVQIGTTATTSALLNANGSIDAAGSGKILEDGMDLVPAGTVIMWYGSIDGSGYPLMGATPNTNWRVCDGTSGTPDLRERFIVGAGGNNASVPGGAYSLSNTGGEVTHALTVAEMSAHAHAGTTNSGGAHTHDVGSIPNGGEGYSLAYNSSNEVFKWGQTGTVTSTSAGSHTHTFTTNTNGSGTAHENRPSYYAIYYIVKL